jgi:hypothetical protein
MFLNPRGVGHFVLKIESISRFVVEINPTFYGPELFYLTLMSFNFAVGDHTKKFFPSEIKRHWGYLKQLFPPFFFFLLNYRKSRIMFEIPNWQWKNVPASKSI